jgi:hypothetical protein
LQEFELFIDDVLVFKGHLRPAPEHASAGAHEALPVMQSILFTDDPAVVAREVTCPDLPRPTAGFERPSSYRPYSSGQQPAWSRLDSLMRRAGTFRVHPQ